MSLHVVSSAYAGDQERLRRGEHGGNEPAVRSSTKTHFILHTHWHGATTAVLENKEKTHSEIKLSIFN